MPRPVVDRANWGAAFKAKILVVIVSGTIYIEALEELRHKLLDIASTYSNIFTNASLGKDRLTRAPALFGYEVGNHFKVHVARYLPPVIRYPMSIARCGY